MPEYRRALVPGATWFFTVNLGDRQSTHLVGKIFLPRAAAREVRRGYPYRIEAAVVLPDHLHAVWTWEYLGKPIRWRVQPMGFYPSLTDTSEKA